MGSRKRPSSALQIDAHITRFFSRRGQGTLVDNAACEDRMTDKPDASAPNFQDGFLLADVPDGGTVAGRVDDEDAILVRQGEACFAVGAHCTHYHGPLAEGLVTGDTVRCPWHHSCFSLRTGEAV